MKSEKQAKKAMGPESDNDRVLLRSNAVLHRGEIRLYSVSLIYCFRALKWPILIYSLVFFLLGFPMLCGLLLPAPWGLIGWVPWVIVAVLATIYNPKGLCG